VTPLFHSAYRCRRVLVTGGAGFIGSNLARRLVNLEARVVIVDALLPGSGANSFNLTGLESRLEYHVGDISDDTVAKLLADCDVVFNLAGQIDHLLSVREPLQDLQNNCAAQLAFLESCRRAAAPMRLVFASTRQVYGPHLRLPVDEQHPTRPVDLNAVHKLAAEAYHSLYAQLHGIPTTILRLSNVFGPRMPLCPRASAPVLGRFLQKALTDETIEVFGDGTQLRDPLYVDDAVDAFLAAGTLEHGSEPINIAGAEPISLESLARHVSEVAGKSAGYRLIPFPEERRRIDIGSSWLDCAKAARVLGWRPRTSLADGLAETVAYYRRHASHYA
jgi:UDP-glucose 4-epimerase